MGRKTLSILVSLFLLGCGSELKRKTPLQPYTITDVEFQGQRALYGNDTFSYQPSQNYIRQDWQACYPPWLYRPVSSPWVHNNYSFWFDYILDYLDNDEEPVVITPTPVVPEPVAPISINAVSRVLFSSGENDHTVGGRGCGIFGSGWDSLGTFADCGNARCYGNQRACKYNVTENIPSTNGRTIVVDYFLTNEGQHKVGGPPCPAGYESIGTNADCGGGKCNGNQRHCIMTVSASSLKEGSTYVSKIYYTAEGAHQVGGPSCGSGYSSAGTVADCGGGKCYGNQRVCVLKLKIKR